MMLKTLILSILIGSIGFIESTSAQPVRVLISISKEKISHRFAEKMIHQLSRRGFDSSEFSITENADQFALFQALNAPETQALIWISHGATPHLTHKMRRQLPGATGMSAQPELVDYRGDNVAPVFKKYSSNIKYVAVIGCNSAQILDYVGSDLAHDSSIDKFIPAKKVVAQFAIRKTAKQLAQVALNPSTPTPTIDPSWKTISITRSIPANALAQQIRPLRIMIGTTLIGVLPALAPGESHTWLIPVMDTDIKQVRLESGQNIMTPANDVDFGDLRVLLPNQIELKPFSKRDGTPFGLNFRLYILP